MIEPAEQTIQVIQRAINDAIEKNDPEAKIFLDNHFKTTKDTVIKAFGNVKLALRSRITELGLAQTDSIVAIDNKIALVDYYLEYLKWQNEPNSQFDFNKIELEKLYNYQITYGRAFLSDTFLKISEKYSISEIAKTVTTTAKWLALEYIYLTKVTVENKIKIVDCNIHALENYSNDTSILSSIRIVKGMLYILSCIEKNLLYPFQKELHIENNLFSFVEKISSKDNSLFLPEKIDVTKLPNEVKNDIDKINNALKNYAENLAILKDPSFLARYKICIAIKTEIDSIKENKSNFIEKLNQYLQQLHITSANDLHTQCKNICIYISISKEENKQDLSICKKIRAILDNPELTKDKNLKLLLTIKQDFNDSTLDQLGISGVGIFKGVKTPDTVKKIREILQNVSLYISSAEATTILGSLKVEVSKIKLTDKQYGYYQKIKLPNISEKIIDGRHILIIALYIKTMELLEIKPALVNTKYTASAVQIVGNLGDNKEGLDYEPLGFGL